MIIMDLNEKLNKFAKNKEESVYKTIYLKKSLFDKIQRIADDNNLSFSNVVASMIEIVLEDLENSNKTDNK